MMSITPLVIARFTKFGHICETEEPPLIVSLAISRMYLLDYHPSDFLTGPSISIHHNLPV